MLNAFERFNAAPPTEEEYIRREEDIERTQERRLLALDLAYEYGPELQEFTGSHSANLFAETGCTMEEVYPWLK